MFARIGTWQGSEEELDRWIDRSREQVKPRIAEDPGLVAAYWLVDRSAGKGLIVTLWESEAAMRASEQARLRTAGGDDHRHRCGGHDGPLRGHR